MLPTTRRPNNFVLLPLVALLALSATGAMGAADPGNTFARFLGDWKLKSDRFQQVWDGKTVETLTMPAHLTRCQSVNTARSVLCVVDAGDLKGHILWVYDADAHRVNHLSHFGTARSGVGSGTLDAHANLRLTIRFQDEPPGSYRVYEYTWVSDDEYSMISRQYRADGSSTGNWYGGSFVRVKGRH
jgi:hypothetical protein